MLIDAGSDLARVSHSRYSLKPSLKSRQQERLLVMDSKFNGLQKANHDYLGHCTLASSWLTTESCTPVPPVCKRETIRTLVVST